MHQYAYIWQAVAGLALFLIGLQFMERAFNRLSGRGFKLFLKKQTAHPLRSIAGGAIITAILQSSSVVNLIVLAFAGAGVLQLQNSLGLILGANLGTTITTWIIATLGFSFEIKSFAMPLIALGGLVFALSRREKNINYWSRIFLGMGLLFMGLALIKDGIADVVSTYDLSKMNNYPLIIFLLAGFIITTIIQSSSATLAIVLSAVYVDAISLYSAMVIVLGSEVGTATKLMFASAGGTALKKRIALGSLLFNIFPVLLVFIFLNPVHTLLKRFSPVENDLVILAFFQSFINLLSIILFFPVLNPLCKYLNSLFTSQKGQLLYLSKSIVRDEDLALEAFKKEATMLLTNSIDFTASCMNENAKVMSKDELHPGFDSRPLMKKYEFIKEVHGQMGEYFIAIQRLAEKADVTLSLENFMTSARNSMYAAKSMKDTLQDIHMLSNSSNNVKFVFFKEERENTISFCRRLAVIVRKANSKDTEELIKLYKTITDDYSMHLQQLYQQQTEARLNDVELSTLINFNRQIATAHKALFFAAKDLFLDHDVSQELENLPGFIR